MGSKVEMTANSSAVWTVGMGAGVNYCFLSFWQTVFLFFLSSLPSLFHSVLPRHQCSLIIFQTATSLSVCFEKGPHTQRTVCLNLKQTKFTSFHDAERGHPTLSHPLAQHDSGMTTLTLQSEQCPAGHSHPLVSVFPNASPRPPYPFCSHKKPRRGWPVGGEYDNTLQRKWAQSSGM